MTTAKTKPDSIHSTKKHQIHHENLNDATNQNKAKKKLNISHNNWNKVLIVKKKKPNKLHLVYKTKWGITN